MSKIGRFGEFGGQYIPETVMTAVHELEKAYDKYKDDPEFNKELQELYHNYAPKIIKREKGGFFVPPFLFLSIGYPDIS